MGDIEKILAEREKTHGDFKVHSMVSQSLKDCMRRTTGWGSLTHVQREGLEMIMHKISRILCGDSQFKDHYLDVCGYATLVLKEIEGKQ